MGCLQLFCVVWYAQELTRNINWPGKIENSTQFWANNKIVTSYLPKSIQAVQIFFRPRRGSSTRHPSQYGHATAFDYIVKRILPNVYDKSYNTIRVINYSIYKIVNRWQHKEINKLGPQSLYYLILSASLYGRELKIKTQIPKPSTRNVLYFINHIINNFMGYMWYPTYEKLDNRYLHILFGKFKDILI